MRTLGGIAAVVALAAFAAGAHALAAGQECGPAQLRGTLAEIPYTRTRTTLHYTLTLTNKTGAECGMMGAPAGVLLGKTKKVLPTHVLKPAGSRLYVVLRPGQSARSSVLISRVAAKGEPKTACEPLAYWFRLRWSNGRGSLDVALKPAARACGYGKLDVTYYGPG